MQVIEYQNRRVLTTAKLAQSYETDSKIISQNFNRNKDRYADGKHFIALQGDEKREFLDRLQIEDGSKNAPVLYLWTEKGAWMHAKSLNTDKAWEAYELLIDEYYRIKDEGYDSLPKASGPEIPPNIVHVEKLLAILRENRDVIGQPLSDAFQSYIAEVLTGKPLQQSAAPDSYRPLYSKAPLAIGEPQNFISQNAPVYEKWYLTRDIAEDAGVSTQMVAVVAKKNGLKSEPYIRVARSDPRKASGLVQVFYNEDARCKLLKLLENRKPQGRGQK